MDCQGACASVPRLERVGLARFTRTLHLRNRPAVLAGLTDSWLCRREWAAGANALQPAWDGLVAAWTEDDRSRAQFPVVECPLIGGQGDECAYGEQQRRNVAAGVFLRQWRERACGARVLRTSRRLYAKDIHLALHYDALARRVYRTPVLFADDWLNWWWAHTRGRRADDDFKFLYMGERGSWTGLHHDVLCSASWSVNVCGRKLWLFFKPGPGTRRGLFDRTGNTTVPDGRAPARARAGTGTGTGTDVGTDTCSAPAVAGFGAEQLRQLMEAAGRPDEECVRAYAQHPPLQPPDAGRFPHWAEAAAHRIAVVQWPGDAVFVPAGWYHQVHNLDDTISINHNWFNACDLEHVWRFLCEELHAVEKELAHLRAPGDGTPPLEGAEWHSQCACVMRANCGISAPEFTCLLHVKATELAAEPGPYTVTGDEDEDEEENEDEGKGATMLRHVSIVRTAALLDAIVRLRCEKRGREYCSFCAGGGGGASLSFVVAGVTCMACDAVAAAVSRVDAACGGGWGRHDGAVPMRGDIDASAVPSTTDLAAARDNCKRLAGAAMHLPPAT